MLQTELNSFKDMSKFFEDREVYNAMGFYNSYFEGLGLFVREGFIDIGLVAKLISGTIIFYWERYRDFFIDWRKESGNARQFVAKLHL